MPRLKVIRASAGSGKTFTLAHEYLSLLFADTGYFVHILAVTFTNKATNEMKSRIVRELHHLATQKPSHHLSDLMKVTGLSETQIRSRAVIILKKLLHHYSSFSVTTIDSFFQRIIRAFTRELGIQGAYSIELDTDTLLTEVINRMLLKAETDKPLLLWLTRYAQSLIEKGENWNFRDGIRTLGKEIFSEKFKSMGAGDAARLQDRDFLLQFQAGIQARLFQIRKEYEAFGNAGIEIFQSAGLTVADFSNKERGPAGFLSKLKEGEFKEVNTTAREAAVRIEKWYTKKSPYAHTIASLEEKLLPLMLKAVGYYDMNFRLYFTLEAVLKNLFTLGILTDLAKLTYSWCNENNAFLLPEAPVFLNQIIDRNDTPFIYEKAGTWYHHFMIDEFQDTSLLQWQNFKPLISNSLSQDFDNLVVGDVKQSVYRWRNSNWEILDHELEHDFPSGVIEDIALLKNWRSQIRVIQFNNLFFKKAASILQQEYNAITEADQNPENSTIIHLYGDIEQQPGKIEAMGGKVEVLFIEENEENSFADRANIKLVSLLCSLQDEGYALRDIAIIARKNKEAKQLADFLITWGNAHPDSNYRFDVISDEALRLGSSSVVVFLVSLLTSIVNPNDKISKYLILSFGKNTMRKATRETDWIMPANDEIQRESEFRSYMPPEFFELADSIGSLSLIETIERLICIFNLAQFQGERVYLQAFRDLVNEYSHTYSADPSRFLEYWNETGMEKSVSAPSGQDAVRILTVHKAKGLEFNIVIMPYCTWEINSTNKSILWCHTDIPPLDALELLPVSYTSKLRDTLFASDYYTEYFKQYVDNLNLLYVAFTRACEGLYVFCKKNKGEQIKTVSDLVARVFKDGPGGNEELSFMEKEEGGLDFATRYSYGTLKKGTKPGEPRIPYPAANRLSIRQVSERIQIAFQGRIFLDPSVNQPKRPLNEGRILHEIFTSILTQADIEPSVNNLYLQGKINLSEKEKYIPLIRHLMNDFQVLSWFSRNWEVHTEAEIILPAGGTKRPDRVMTRNGETLIIDYKFGKIEKAYERQLKEYADLLSQMEYKNIEAWLWYVMLGKVVKVELSNG